MYILTLPVEDSKVAHMLVHRDAEIAEVDSIGTAAEALLIRKNILPDTTYISHEELLVSVIDLAAIRPLAIESSFIHRLTETLCVIELSAVFGAAVFVHLTVGLAAEVPAKNRERPS